MAMTQMTTPSQWFRRGSLPTVSGLTGDSLRDDPFARIHDEMNRLFDSFFGNTGWSVSQPLSGSGASLAAVMQPQLDIFETEDSYQLSVELPGVDRDSVDLSVDDDALVIRARKEREVKTGNDNQYHRVERRFGRFERMLTLPADADSDQISAELSNGVLEVTIPRRKDIESVRGRRIEIKSS
ncbi:MAG: Hsp20/alpha crystallin family protein [Pseudomonadota bacterium]|nr:MAG: Hsp20/alpha crystallin family protein [Pseudomonadota bacterium]